MPEYVDVDGLMVVPRSALMTETAPSAGQAAMLTLLQERIIELELQLETEGWMRMSLEGEREFSQEGLRKIINLCELYYLKNPLIKRAANLSADYVMGQGISISARHPKVNDIVQAFMDDPANVVELTGHKARQSKERALRLTGNLFLALFTNRKSGRVRVRSIPPEEITAIITDPEDRRKVWFYKREIAGGTATMEQLVKGQASAGQVRTILYPDWSYQPLQKPTRIADWEVMWDAPTYHVKAGGLDKMKYGLPDMYAALDWAKAVKEDLEDWASIRRSHARFAWNMTTKGGSRGVAAAKSRLGTTLAAGGSVGVEANPPPTVASTFISAEGVNMAPVRTAGAQPSPEEARRLGLMVGAAVGLPETMLFGNADVGNLATAKTLDRPTELMMVSRRTDWETVFRDIITYVLHRAIDAQKLPGKLERDPDTGDLVAKMAVDQDAEPDPETGQKPEVDLHVDVDWPDLLEREILPRVQAVVAAAATGRLSDKLVSRLLMQALGVDDIDEELELLYPSDDQNDELPQGDDGVPTPQAQQAQFIAALRELREYVARQMVEARGVVVANGTH